MADRQIYFQWQNEVLERTIYPLREMKLRHVLEFDMEIQLWDTYKKHKDVADLSLVAELAGDISAYHERRAIVITQAVKALDDLDVYFKQPDMTAFYKQKLPDIDKLAALDDKKPAKVAINAMTDRINAVHAAFIAYYFPAPDKDTDDEIGASKFKDANKESYFISQQLQAWDKQRKDLDLQVWTQINRVAAIRQNNPNHPNLPDEEQLLWVLQNILQPLLNAERKMLVNLAAAHDKLVQRKLDYAASVKKALVQEADIKLKQTPLQIKIKPLDSQFAALDGDLQRLRTLLTPPAPDTEKNFFASADVSAEIRQRFPQVDQKMVDAVNRFHIKVADLYNHIKNDAVKLVMIKPVLADLQTFSRSLAHENTIALAIAGAEIEHFKDLLFVLENSKKSQAELDAMTKAKEVEKAQVQVPLNDLKKDAADLQSQIDALDDILRVTEEKYVSTYIPVTPKLKDFINQKLDDFRATLMNGDKERDQYELLKMILDLFAKRPERYPRWLQYMIIHFSGMRYSSAHGSWADPASLYVRLNNPTITDEYQLQKLTDELKKEMTSEQALTKIQEMKDKLPAWMWKEISAVTHLRLKEAQDEDWGHLTLDEQKERNKPQWATFRSIIIAWKEQYLTSWREEHGRTHQLIVIRAVCNEVAEHIQHLRGHYGAAGLAGKPDLYRGAEYRSGLPDPKPADAAYWRVPKTFDDFKVGVSILWLRYKSDQPGDWEVVKDYTAGSDPLVPDRYTKVADGPWVYRLGGLERMNAATRHTQYLFWIHEATVACRAETAEGNVALTFETALPYEDHRMAAVGMFKRNDFNLLYDGGEDLYNGCVTGYMPENKDGLPETDTEKLDKALLEKLENDLDDMLNWEHVLLKS